MTDPGPPIIELAHHERVIRPKPGLVAVNFAELWRYRELFWFLAWRDILVRYKQAYLGVGWAVLQPVLTTLIFTVLFGKLANLAGTGVPFETYAVMTLAGLLPWRFFANAMSESSHSLVGSASMISKIYFPRLIIPASAVISGVLDFAIGLVILLALMVGSGAGWHLHLLLLPLFFLAAFVAAFSIGLWLSALNVRYRDVKHIVPFLVQMGMFLTPVGYPSSLVREKLGETAFFVFSLNPMVGVVDGFRWGVLGAQYEPYWPGFLVSLGVITILLVGGALYFRHAEKTFADVI